MKLFATVALGLVFGCQTRSLALVDKPHTVEPINHADPEAANKPALPGILMMPNETQSSPKIIEGNISYQQCSNIIEEIAQFAVESGLSTAQRSSKTGDFSLVVYSAPKDSDRAIYGIVVFKKSNQENYIDRCQLNGQTFDMIKM